MNEIAQKVLDKLEPLSYVCSTENMPKGSILDLYTLDYSCRIVVYELGDRILFESYNLMMGDPNPKCHSVSKDFNVSELKNTSLYSMLKKPNYVFVSHNFMVGDADSYKTGYKVLLKEEWDQEVEIFKRFIKEVYEDAEVLDYEDCDGSSFRVSLKSYNCIPCNESEFNVLVKFIGHQYKDKNGELVKSVDESFLPPRNFIYRKWKKENGID